MSTSKAFPGGSGTQSVLEIVARALLFSQLQIWYLFTCRARGARDDPPLSARHMLDIMAWALSNRSSSSKGRTSRCGPKLAS
jgi:hypothetical protein